MYLKFKELRQIINEQKMDRDELNEKVKKLKQKKRYNSFGN